MDRLFFDTNVLLDVLERRPPWFPEALQCLARVQTRNCQGAFTALSLSDIAYIQRATPVATINQAFRQLRAFLEIAPLVEACVDAALKRKTNDLEDGLQLEAALAWNATHLLTRNVKDFPSNTPLTIQSPADYLNAANNRRS